MKTATITYISMFSNPAPMPLKTTLSIISAIGTIPASGLRLSCMLFTEPLDVAVVSEAQVAEATGPKRTSLPSIFGPLATGSPIVAALGLTSARMAITQPVTSSESITPKMTIECLRSLSMIPAMTIDDIGRTTMEKIESMLLQGLGFS